MSDDYITDSDKMKAPIDNPYKWDSKNLKTRKITLPKDNCVFMGMVINGKEFVNFYCYDTYEKLIEAMDQLAKEARTTYFDQQARRDSNSCTNTKQK